jgi:hypothetical protein
LQHATDDELFSLRTAFQRLAQMAKFAAAPLYPFLPQEHGSHVPFLLISPQYEPTLLHHQDWKLATGNLTWNYLVVVTTTISF